MGRRGYEVALADQSDGGGRAEREATLPGLSSYKRVSDYRLGQIAKMNNVGFFPGSEMTADDIREFDADEVLIATGAHWRDDGLGRYTLSSVPGVKDHPRCWTPDDLIAGRGPEKGSVVVYDDDHYYMGGILAGMLADRGLTVTLVTPGPEVSCWTANTMEQHRIEKTLSDKGVRIVEKHTLSSIDGETLNFSHNTTDRAFELQAQAVVLVTIRIPNSSIYFSLAGEEEEHLDALPFRLKRIGDCMAPSTIAAAVYDGHRVAREIDNLPDPDAVPFKRERPLIQIG